MPLVSWNVTFPNIRIDDAGGSSTFVLTVREALDRIASQPKGARMLAEINAGPAFGAWNGVVKIYRAQGVVDPNNPGAEGGSKASAVREDLAKNGIGSPSGVAWNPNIYVVPGQGSRPPFIGLAHELVHAWHNVNGIKRQNYDEEEEFTVGLGQWAVANPNAITENVIRLEHGLSIRLQY